MDIPEKVLTPLGDDLNDQTPIEGSEGEPTPLKTPDSGEGLNPEEVDYKVKFSESTRENDRLREVLLTNEELIRSKDQEIAELEVKLARANEISSEDSVSEKYPSWENMTEGEKDIARNMAIGERDKEWETGFVKIQREFPILVDKEDEFRKFCKRYPKSVDPLTLAKSFLYSPKGTAQKRKGLESPTSGPKDVTPGQLSGEDVKRLREENPRKYEKLVKEGRIDFNKLK